MSKKFAGKFAFQSTNTSGEQKYMTSKNKNKLYYPFMDSAELKDSEKCIIYKDLQNGYTLIEMNCQKFLTLKANMAWIVCCEEEKDAGLFKSTVSTDGMTAFEIYYSDTKKWLPVMYTVNTLLPYVIVSMENNALQNSDEEELYNFKCICTTPGLDVIKNTKNAAGFDFKRADLSDADFSGVDCTGANFTSANLTGTVFRGAKLKNAVFMNAILNHTDFSNTVLDRADLSGTDLSNVIWGTGVSAREANFSNCTAIKCNIGSSDVSKKIDFTKAKLDGADFSFSNLKNVILKSATLFQCNLTGCNLELADFSSAQLGGLNQSAAASLSNTYIANTNFEKANLFGVSFAFSTIRGNVNMENASTMEQTDFSNAYLAGINLTGAILRGAKFNNACLVCVNLTNSVLSPTLGGSVAVSFIHACLQGAEFTNAILDYTDFTDAAISFDKGSLPVRYRNENGDLVPPPPDYRPYNYNKTVGMDFSTLKQSTICPNGSNLASNIKHGLTLEQILTSPRAPSKWQAVECTHHILN